jgi:hypothetical protein
MKIFNTFLVIALVSAHSCYALPSSQVCFYGTIQFPSKTENPPPLTLLFKGTEFALILDKDSKISKRGMFEIYEDRDCSEFHILITENLKLPNTLDIEYLETSNSHPYKLYKLTRKAKTREIVNSVGSEQLGTQPTVSLELIEYWDIEDLDCNEPTIKIPDNTIILLMNPQFIIRLITETWHPNDAFVKLPRILFDDSVDEKALQEVSTKMVFAAIDLRCLHKRMTKTTKACAQNRIISVPDPLNCYVSNHARSA